ncbi:MAG: hypothetical protein M1480_11035 [Bacteroidetes bacterium]|nr:hypothetical protein [Bacteroidota bacterium]
MKKLNEIQTTRIIGGVPDDPHYTAETWCENLYALLLSQSDFWYITINREYWSDWVACPQYVDDI